MKVQIGPNARQLLVQISSAEGPSVLGNTRDHYRLRDAGLIFKAMGGWDLTQAGRDAIAVAPSSPKCGHLGPRIPMIQHERPTCQLGQGHQGDHCARVGWDQTPLQWPAETASHIAGDKS